MGRIRTTRQAKLCRIEAMRGIIERKTWEMERAARRAAMAQARQTEVIALVLNMQGVPLPDPAGNTEGLPKLEPGQSAIINRYGDTEVVDTGDIPVQLPKDSIVIRRPRHGGS